MMVDATILDVIRLITGTILLAYASYTDLKTRRAANILWVIMAIVGIILLIIQYLGGGFPNLWYLVFIPIMIVTTYAFFQLRLLLWWCGHKSAHGTCDTCPNPTTHRDFSTLAIVPPRILLYFFKCITSFPFHSHKPLLL